LSGLAVIEPHPVQYRAPIYRLLQQRCGVPVTAIYGSDCSVVGYVDSGFGREIRWDVDLLLGYRSVFLSRVRKKGTPPPRRIRLRSLFRVLRQEAPAAVLLTGYHPIFHQQAFLCSLWAGVPILFRAETTGSPGGLGGWGYLRRCVLRWEYRRCQKLLYIGTLSRRHYKHLGVPEEKLAFSPYSVDTTPFQWNEEARQRLRRQTRNALGLGDSDRVLLFSGKLIPCKGLDLLLQAVQNFPGKLVVLFLGDGALRERLEKMAAQLQRGNVLFLGFQNQTELSPYYHAADLLVLPSHSETWGLVVNEALHHGLPCVVSTAVGCAPDLVEPGSTGELFQAGSVPELTAAIQRGLVLMNSSQIRDRCRSKANNFSLQRSAEGIADAFRAVT